MDVVTDAQGRKTQTNYFADGQVQQVIKAYQSATMTPITYATYAYTANGQVDTVDDARGFRTKHTYDGMDRLLRMYFPSATVQQHSTTDYEEYGYDPSGNQISKRVRAGQTITMAYDALNRETTHAFVGTFPRTVTTNYDLAGRKYDVALPDQTIKHRYDPAARLDFVDDTYLGATNYRTDYGYDPAGNRTSIAYPGGGTFSYSFDALNQMKTVGESGGVTTLVEYDWDTLSRRSLARFNNYTFQSSYGYEDDDDLNSLAHTGPSALTFTIVRNNVSQITQLTASNAAFLAKPAMTKADAYSPNHLNQYTQVGGVSISGDANGNVTGDGTYTFAYDVENRLMSAVGAGNTVSYQYDPLGRRRAKIVNGVTTKYASDQAEEIEERDGSNAVLRKYAYGPSIDDRIAMKDSTGVPATCAGAQNWCFYLTNWQGSTTTLINQSGSVKDTYHYGPYGERVNWNPTDPDTGNPFRYTGRRYDPETGLYYYRARYYSPKWGRFLQTDPIGTKDDLNLYAYVYNDPVNRTDPTGACGSHIGGNSSGNCETVQVNQSTKVQGKPQKTGTRGHDTTSAKVGQQMKESGQYKSVHLNQKMSTITGDPAAGGQQPDVAGVRHSGQVDTVEVTSKSQTPAQMEAKGQAMQAKLAPEMRGTHQVVEPTAAKPSGGGGTAAKGLGVAGAGVGIVSAVLAAYDNPDMGAMEFMYRAAGMYEVAVAAGYLPPPQEMH